MAPPDLRVPRPARRARLASPAPDHQGLDEDLAWLADVLGATDGPAVRFRPRVADGEVRLLVPLDPPAAAAAALHRPHDHRSRAQRIAAALAGRAAGAGLLALLPGTRLTLPPFALVDHLAGALGHPGPGPGGGLTAAVTLGPRRRNRKPVLQLIEPSGVVVGFAKVGWSPLTTSLVDNEAEVLSLVADRLPPWLVAPRILHHGPWRSGTVAVAGALGAEPGPGSHDGSAPARDLVAVVRAIAGCDLDHPIGPVPVAALGPIAEWRAAGAGDRVDLERLVDHHATVTLPVGLWHGDLTPWNMAATPGGLLLWDWEFAGPGRPVGFDLLHHRFEQHRRAPGGTSERALASVVAEAAAVVGPLGLALDQTQIDALVDLYLLELLAREARLDGQRWTGPQADLAPAVVAMLRGRSARWTGRPTGRPTGPAR